MIQTLHTLQGALRAALTRALPWAGIVTGFTVLIERQALRRAA